MSQLRNSLWHTYEIQFTTSIFPVKDYYYYLCVWCTVAVNMRGILRMNHSMRIIWSLSFSNRSRCGFFFCELRTGLPHLFRLHEWRFYWKQQHCFGMPHAATQCIVHARAHKMSFGDVTINWTSCWWPSCLPAAIDTNLIVATFPMTTRIPVRVM